MIVQSYVSADRETKLRRLSKTAYFFSMLGRETYEAGTENVIDPPRLRLINEAQHRMIDQLMQMLIEAECYPDDVFAKIIADQFRALGIDPAYVLTVWE